MNVSDVNMLHIKHICFVLQMPLFWCPTELILPNVKYEEPLPTNPLYPINYIKSEGFIYEAQAVRECLLKGML